MRSIGRPWRISLTTLSVNKVSDASINTLQPFDAVSLAHTEHDRFRDFRDEKFDVIVIGAGIGGLTSAALLSQRGYSVLVLDMHYALGGCATVFHRRGKGQGYEFDVGLHYVGDSGPDGLIPRILRGAGVEDISFLEQDPDGFDTLCFPDFKFRVPRGVEVFRDRLVEMFPGEVRGIDRYVKLLRQVWGLMSVHANPVSAFRVLPKSLMALKYANATVKEFLDTCTHDERLRAVLTGQLGVYHQPPSRASLMGHAGVSMHFLQGSFYPSGGGQTLSDRFADVIERNGNKILLRTKAKRIITRDGKVVGVEFENKALGTQVAYAPVVISNADLKQTMLQLVGDDQLSKKASHRVRGYEMSPAMGVVYLGVKRNFREEGMANTNFRLYPSYDFETVYREVAANRFPAQPHIFVGNATLKDPDNPALAPPGVTNMQLMSVVPSSFGAWGVSEEEYKSCSYRKSRVYHDNKKAFAESLIHETERVIPGLAKDIVFQEVSTPITLMRYTAASNGTSYGMSLVPWQFLYRRPGPCTDVKGLFLCGASLRTGHGIFGAMTSGVEAAAMVVGRRLVGEVLGARRDSSGGGSV